MGGRAEGWMDGQANEWVKGWVGGRMEGWMDGRADEWLDT